MEKINRREAGHFYEEKEQSEFFRLFTELKQLIDFLTVLEILIIEIGSNLGNISNFFRREEIEIIDKKGKKLKVRFIT